VERRTRPGQDQGGRKRTGDGYPVYEDTGIHARRDSKKRRTVKVEKFQILLMQRGPVAEQGG